jgi:hypothetical protein
MNRTSSLSLKLGIIIRQMVNDENIDINPSYQAQLMQQICDKYNFVYRPNSNNILASSSGDLYYYSIDLIYTLNGEEFTLQCESSLGSSFCNITIEHPNIKHLTKILKNNEVEKTDESIYTIKIDTHVEFDSFLMYLCEYKL